MFDLFNAIATQANARVIEFHGRYAIVTPFGYCYHYGQRKHIVYTWNKRYAQSLEKTIGKYWKANANKWLKVAYSYQTA
jgi:hypothetical protein